MTMAIFNLLLNFPMYRRPTCIRDPFKF